MGLSVLDYCIAAGSIALVLLVAAVGCLSKRTAGGAAGFFLAGRNMPWFICAASLFASNVGTEHFVGMAGSGATGGLAVGLYEWTASYQILMLGWIFAPIYLRCQLTTIPEFFEGRYNKYCRFLFVLLTMAAYITTKLSASLYAGGVILEVVAGLNLWQSVPLIIVATAVYTVMGGLTAVMLTDTVQMLIFLFGGIFGAIKCLQLVDGFSGLSRILKDNNLEYMTHMIHSADDRDYPWPGTLIGLPITSVWYWCLDQEMAQRVLSAKNLNHAQLGAATGAFLKIIPVLITVVPGMVARALYEECTVSGAFPEWCADPTQSLADGNVADRAYPWLVIRQFPNGLRGVMVASFLAAMMSSLSSVYNSAATIFTYDVYNRFWYPNEDAPPGRLVIVGRITVVVLTICTFLWIPVIAHSPNGIFLSLQNATMHLVPPVVAIAMLAVFWRRANGPGAFSGLVAGTVFGTVALIISLVYEDECKLAVTESSAGLKQVFTAQNWWKCLGFLYIAIVLFVFTSLVTIVVSLLTPPPREDQLEGRMFKDWGFWVKICRCCSTTTDSSLEPAEQNDPEKSTALLPAETEDGEGREVQGSQQGKLEKMGTALRAVTNLSGVAVLVVITSLIITFH